MKKIIFTLIFTLIFGMTYSQITISANRDVICVLDTVRISMQGIASSVEWDFGEDATPSFASTIGPHIIKYTTPGIKIILIDALIGGVTVKDSLKITVSQLDSTDVDLNLNVDPSAQYILNASVNVRSTVSVLPYSYRWFVDDVIMDSVNNPFIYTFSQASTYAVKMVMKDAGGCEVSKSSTFTSVDIFKAPNVFTPNNDGENDEFKIESTGLIEFSMEIYDRWGSLVYNPKIVGTQLIWDGRNSAGIIVKTGVYFYVVTPEDPTIEPLKGFIHLYR
ncbi:MAG: gliding motility-associated C-terminal domain-containing protein [Salinivirgaceae bacterium]|nr:gliding motility-associated C-terminal domain-containing protein [Salinivirgaceae bacterium]